MRDLGLSHLPENKALFDSKWTELSPEKKTRFEEMAREDAERYERELERGEVDGFVTEEANKRTKQRKKRTRCNMEHENGETARAGAGEGGDESETDRVAKKTGHEAQPARPAKRRVKRSKVVDLTLSSGEESGEKREQGETGNQTVSETADTEEVQSRSEDEDAEGQEAGCESGCSQHESLHTSPASPGRKCLVVKQDMPADTLARTLGALDYSSDSD